MSFARMLLEQADNMKDYFGSGEKRAPKFSVSCQHYSFRCKCLCGSDQKNMMQISTALLSGKPRPEKS